MSIRSSATPARGDAGDVDILWNQFVTMRDGVRLKAAVYLPKDRAGPLPTVISQSAGSPVWKRARPVCDGSAAPSSAPCG